MDKYDNFKFGFLVGITFIMILTIIILWKDSNSMISKDSTIKCPYCNKEFNMKNFDAPMPPLVYQAPIITVKSKEKK